MNANSYRSPWRSHGLGRSFVQSIAGCGAAQRRTVVQTDPCVCRFAVADSLGATAPVNSPTRAHVDGQLETLSRVPGIGDDRHGVDGS